MNNDELKTAAHYRQVIAHLENERQQNAAARSRAQKERSEAVLMRVEGAEGSRTALRKATEAEAAADANERYIDAGLAAARERLSAAEAVEIRARETAEREKAEELVSEAVAEALAIGSLMDQLGERFAKYQGHIDAIRTLRFVRPDETYLARLASVGPENALRVAMEASPSFLRFAPPALRLARGTKTLAEVARHQLRVPPPRPATARESAIAAQQGSDANREALKTRRRENAEKARAWGVEQQNRADDAKRGQGSAALTQA